MTDLTLSQKIRLGLGFLALSRKHADLIPELKAAVNDAFALWNAVVPLGPKVVSEPIHEVIGAHLTSDEQVQWANADRASNPKAGGA